MDLDCLTIKPEGKVKLVTREMGIKKLMTERRVDCRQIGQCILPTYLTDMTVVSLPVGGMKEITNNVSARVWMITLTR